MYLKVAPEIRRALAAKRPVVALESTIITHGMPYPENLETARSLESQVRAGGAVPATIAVIGGVICAGLSDQELEWLATAKNVMKVSRNDLAYAIASKRIGATTVAATMICAHQAGIQVFATGGIGGVHRNAELDFDISADLDELARTPVAVVASGAKALLDIPRTLEYLETRGVPVAGYGTDEFPAFWSRRSGLKTPFRIDSPAEAARFLQVQWELKLGGVLICNPVPEADEVPYHDMRGIIEDAIGEAASYGIKGKAVTPYLLARIAEKSGGRSLRANVALAQSNARVAAEIAVAMQG
jgi:pseudouridine-5'-phosphate glycosidase